MKKKTLLAWTLVSGGLIVLFLVLAIVMKNNILWWVWAGIIVCSVLIFIALQLSPSRKPPGKKKVTSPRQVWESLINLIAESGDLEGAVFKGGKLFSYDRNLLRPLGRVTPLERNGEPHLFMRFWKGCAGTFFPMGTHDLYINLDSVENVNDWLFDFYPHGHGLIQDFKKHYGSRLLKKSYEEDPQVAIARSVADLSEEDPDYIRKKAVEALKPMIIQQQAAPIPQPQMNGQQSQQPTSNVVGGDVE